MAVSKKREKSAYKVPRNMGKEKKNPKWLVPTMVTLLVGGVAWILTYYVTKGAYPLDIGSWNILAGFGLMMTGFYLTTLWK